MEKNVLLTIEYDGTRFSGWQRQPDQRTVQGVLEGLLTDVIYGQDGRKIEISGTSRTDAGVHALGQRATFNAEFLIPVENLAKVLNDRLQGRPESPSDDNDIRIVSAEEVPDGFHARLDSKGKKYRYMIRNAAELPVFLRSQRYHVPGKLDVEAMRKAASYIVGTHDFACFQASGGEPGESTVRTVTGLSVEKVEAWDHAFDSGPEDRKARDIMIEISGDGFLYNMVRIITGTLVEVGLGKREPEELEGIIESCDRRNAGHTAPPQGLYLVEVYF